MRVCSCTSSCKTVITCIKSPDNVNCGPLCHVNSSRRLQAHELTAISCCYRYHKFLLETEKLKTVSYHCNPADMSILDVQNTNTIGFKQQNRLDQTTIPAAFYRKLQKPCKNPCSTGPPLYERKQTKTQTLFANYQSTRTLCYFSITRPWVMYAFFWFQWISMEKVLPCMTVLYDTRKDDAAYSTCN